jgi:hypothetical protein
VERLTYATLGAVFGCLIGLICWWLYGLAMSRQIAGPGLLPSLAPWLRVFGVGFAAIGFVFKDKVGSAVGSLIAGVLQFEAGTQPKEHHLSWPQVIFVLAALACVAWYFFA